MKQRTEAKDRLLRLYRTKPPLSQKSKQQPLEPARIEPDRRWFGNTRLITQEKLDNFRGAVSALKENPYQVLIKRSNLPLSLLQVKEQAVKKRGAHFLRVESYEKTFGPAKTRKRPKLLVESLGDLKLKPDEAISANPEVEAISLEGPVDGPQLQPEEIFKKGTSRRIWQELYKVIDSSDVIIEVLDARNPVATRCLQLERKIREDRPNKHIVIVLNKCDLVPAWCAQRWLKILSRDFPTIAFHSSLKHAYGKMSLINLLRQYAGLMRERQHVSVGFIGYPNVGKSSVINTLKQKAVCPTAAIPGQTKVWRYISLTRRIHLIDCPGIVPFSENIGPTEKVLHGVVRAEKIATPEEYIPALIASVDRKQLNKVYAANDEWTSPLEFLEIVAKKQGKLLKGGIPDISTMARCMIYDYQRGVIPYYLPPPEKPQKSKATASG